MDKVTCIHDSSVDTPPATDETDTQAFTQLMNDVSANGTSKQTLQADAAAFERVGGKDSQTMNAVENMVNSLSDGTFSQQGTQGALEGAAQRDQIAGITSMPLISGTTGMTKQNGGYFDGGSATETPYYGSVGANANILGYEYLNGAPKDQIINNATALETEATNAGDTAFAAAAKYVADNEKSGTFDPTTATNMINNAFSIPVNR